MKAKRMRGVRVAALMLTAVLLAGLFTACGAGDGKLRTLKLSEVTHSVFYAPQYVALELGFFEEEGLEIELITSEGADHVMTSVISGAVDIGFSGPEAAIYIYNEGKEDYAEVFAQMTQCDGAFIVAREPMENFTIEDLRGAHILPGRKGGVPYMTFEYLVKQNGLIPGVDLNFDSSIQYAAMTGAFLGGTGDFVTIFEPVASTVEAEGKGYVVASIGELAGAIPYTAYYAQKSYIAKNADVIQRFTNAVAKGQKWVAEHTPAEIAEAVAPQFPDADPAILESAIARYQSIGAYATEPFLSEESFNRLMDVMEEAGELSKRADYTDVVNNSFAEKAAG